jgi:hypothetical protein
MKYLLPQDIVNELWISLKTVYNYISKSWNKVRTERRNGKTFINFEDLQSYLQSWLQSIQSDYKSDDVIDKNNTVDISTLKQDLKLQTDYNKLQSNYNSVMERVEQLNKVSSNYQDMAQKYAIRLSEEKEEKKVLQEKYDILEKNYLDKIDAYASLQVGSVKKLYLSLWVVAILLILFGLLFALYFYKLYLF